MENVNLKQTAVVAVAVVIVGLLSACNIQAKHDGDDKKVEIKTPFGELKVDTSVDAKDTGIKVYPGATPREATGDDKHSANVQIGNDRFGLKVAAAEYDSKDKPEKILEFYRKELRSYGKVLECKGTSGDPDVEMNGDDKELSCGKSDGKSDGVTLKAGTPDRQRIVAVHANGEGSRFALVHIQKHGKEDKI
jgi:hypothetical protein